MGISNLIVPASEYVIRAAGASDVTRAETWSYAPKICANKIPSKGLAEVHTKSNHNVTWGRTCGEGFNVQVHKHHYSTYYRTTSQLLNYYATHCWSHWQCTYTPSSLLLTLSWLMCMYIFICAECTNTHSLTYMYILIITTCTYSLLRHVHIHYYDMHIFIIGLCLYVHVHLHYGMATISRLLKIIGLFCRISSLL